MGVIDLTLIPPERYVHCPNCKRKFKANLKVCPYCGYRGY